MHVHMQVHVFHAILAQDLRAPLCYIYEAKIFLSFVPNCAGHLGQIHVFVARTLQGCTGDGRCVGRRVCGWPETEDDTPLAVQLLALMHDNAPGFLTLSAEMSPRHTAL